MGNLIQNREKRKSEEYCLMEKLILYNIDNFSRRSHSHYWGQQIRIRGAIPFGGVFSRPTIGFAGEIGEGQ